MAEKNEPGSPAKAETGKQPSLLESGDYSQYLLHAKSEILFVLRNLLNSVSQITIFFDEGKELLLTTLVGLADDALLLDFGASMETNIKALSAEKLFCVTNHEKVRIQFRLRGLTQVTYEGRPAFRADLPADLLRLQRREFFRLTMPIVHPLKCQIPISGETGNNFVLDINVVDLSGGGLAIALPDGVDFTIGREFPDCRIELPEVGVLATTLKVRNQFEITLRNGSRVKRAGCEFIKLSGQMMTLVQRYIIKVERERKARESGMT